MPAFESRERHPLSHRVVKVGSLNVRYRLSGPPTGPYFQWRQSIQQNVGVSQVIWGGDGSHVEVWPNAEPIVSWCCKPCLSLREFGYPDSESFTGVWHNKITRNSHCAFWLGFLHCARELPGGGVWLKPGLLGSWMCVCWQDSARQLPNRPHMVFQCVWTPGIK